MKSHRITIRLSADLHRRLLSAARRQGKVESELVRQAVETQLAVQEADLSAFDHARKAGLIGAVHGAPSDLSTNRRHFKGFGKS